MNKPMKNIAGSILLLILILFQVAPALARSDHFIKEEIEAQLAESEKLRDAKIEVYVEKRLVVLSGTSRLYEQKLISDRIAWTTPGVSEVDNESGVYSYLR
jgi:osmotically-inducible protein OsmY